MNEMRESIRGGCKWVVVGGRVYDVAGYMKIHPGKTNLHAMTVLNPYNKIRWSILDRALFGSRHQFILLRS